MNIFKIINITILLNKRNPRFNSTLNIDYVENMNKKIIEIKPNETVYLNISSLPISLHKLRANKMVTVIEVAENELINAMSAGKPIVTNNDVLVETEQEKTKHVEKKKNKKNEE
jgi:hypothetical protein